MNYAPADFHLTESSEFCFYSKIEFLCKIKNPENWKKTIFYDIFINLVHFVLLFVKN